MPDARHNIILMVSDDHGLDAGCYGHPAMETPNIDALAADGVRFTHGFCTTASCAASRTVILTGVHGHTNGTYGHTHGCHHYISGNGAAFPVAKTTLYDPGMNLPCIVRSPLHANRGTACDGLVTWADLTPTILGFAGALDDPAAFHGASFKGIIDQRSPTHWRDEILASHTFHEVTNYYPMRVIRSHRWKFIWNIAHQLPYSFASDLWASASWQGALRDDLEHFGSRTLDAYLHRPRFELYDLLADPHETLNLAADPVHADLVRGFCTRLRAFQERTRDPWVHKWDYE